jgi:hypothetical protein
MTNHTVRSLIVFISLLLSFCSLGRSDLNVPEILVSSQRRTVDIDLKQSGAAWANVFLKVSEVGPARWQRTRRELIERHDPLDAVFFVVLIGGAKEIAAADAPAANLSAVARDLQIFVKP